MSDLKIMTLFKGEIKKVVGRDKCVIYSGRFFDNYIFLFGNGKLTSVLIYNENLEKIISHETFQDFTSVKIVGNKNAILTLSSNGSLYSLKTNKSHIYHSSENLDGDSSYSWKELECFNSKKVLAITDFCEDNFACLLVDGNGDKKLKIFKPDSQCLEDYTFSDLNATPSNDYDLSTVETSVDFFSLIISDKLSGEIYLWSNTDQSHLIYCSKFQLISAISVMAQECLLLCFENGKIFIHFFSESSSNCSLFFNKRIVCIEKCFCSEGCLLWSDGAILHHTEINFDNPIVKMTNFKIQNNIIGILSLIKVENFIIAYTINNIFYGISASENYRKELVQTPGNILSQIYNESLKINDFQENIKMASYYMNCKEVLQKNQLFMELEYEGKFLNIKNKSKISFRKEFWTIELKMSNHGCEYVKVVELDTDIISGMIFKFKNPFLKNGRVRVYLSGNFEWEILSMCIGTVEEYDLEKKNLKKKLDEIQVANKLNIEKRNIVADQPN